jgi:HlyD family secretion protein
MRKAMTLIAISTIALLAYWYTSRSEPIAVYLTTIETGRVEATVANTRAGTIKACMRSRISLPVGGQVAELMVDEGDYVKAGQVLIRLWNDDHAARVEEAEARLAVSRAAAGGSCDTAALDARELKRQKGLAEKNLISVEKLDATQTRANVSSSACTRTRAGITTAQATLRLQTALYEKTLLRAPFAGVVAEINGELGEYVTPSPPGVATPPAVDLIGTDCLYVTAPIDEVDAADIRLGLPAKITLDAYRGRIFEGEVSRIAPYVKEFEKQARTVDVDVKFTEFPQDISLLAGYSADIEIVLQDRSNVLRVATEAVIDGNRVLRYDPSTSYLDTASISPGLSNWTYTEIKSGLAEGDTVLLSLDTEGAVAGALVSPIKGDSNTGSP